jgi:hypothetical protein
MISSVSAEKPGRFALGAQNASLRPALQTLQNNLSVGDLPSAQTAYQTLQNIIHNWTTSGGSAVSIDSQFNANIDALGSAISSGNLFNAQTALTQVVNELKDSAFRPQVNEANAAAQSHQLQEGLNSTLSSTVRSSVSSTLSSSVTTTDIMSILKSWFASKSGLNVVG